MKSLYKIILFFFLIFSSFSIGKAQDISNKTSYTPQNRPKLVIGIVVDQMRFEYISRFWNKFGDNGFKRLINNGYYFINAHYNYYLTKTGPGHATIFTGTTPSNHGIIGNHWYVRDLGEEIYVVADSTVQTVGATDDDGQMSPEHLLTTTVTDELKQAAKGSKVVAVSIKDRSAILPGGHLANGAFWYDYDTGNFITSTYYMNELPEWLQAFNKKNLPQKYSHQTWKPLLSIDNYTESHRDNSPYENAFDDNAPVFPHPMDGSLSKIITSPYGNMLVKNMAEAAIKGAKLGKDQTTDFLTVSFSSTDYVGHRFGPNSIEVEDTYLRLDQRLADFLNFLDKHVGKGNYLLFLTADHGAVNVPASLVDSGMPGGYFDSAMAVDSLRGYLSQQYGKGNWILDYTYQQVYLNRKLIQKNNLRLKLVQQNVARFLIQFNGVATTYTAYDLKNIENSEGYPELFQNNYYYKRSGDVYVQLKSGWVDSSERTGTEHGSPYSYDTHVPLIFYGWQIPNGISNQKVVIPQIAPTVSDMLQIQQPSGATHDLLTFQ